MKPVQHKRSPRKPSGASAMAGFSLVEMMISITIGLVIVAALIGVLVSNSGSRKTNDRTAELQGNARYAMDHLTRELRHAGFHGYTPLTNPIGVTGAITNTGALPFCGNSSDFVTNIRQGIWGANDNNPFSGNCLPANYVRGDVLVIRRLDDQATASASGVTNAIYFRTAYDQGTVFQFVDAASVPTVTGNANAENFALWQYVYYIGPDDDDNTLPALRRIRLQTDTDTTPGSVVDEMVVSGIEEMQVQYGVFNSSTGTTQYFDADGLTGSSIDTGATDWDNVHTARIWLLARNANAEPGYVNPNAYAMGDIIYDPGGDSIRRQMLSAVVQLRN